MTTKVVLKVRNTANPVDFSGFLDSDLITSNGDVMRLFVKHCTPIPRGEKQAVRVKILELENDFNETNCIVNESKADKTVAVFEGELEHRGGQFIFSSMKPQKPVDWAQTPLYPFFLITFCNESDTVLNRADNDTKAPTFPVVIGTKTEPSADGKFQIGFILENQDGTYLGSSHSAVSYFLGEYSYEQLLQMLHTRTELNDLNLLHCTTLLNGMSDWESFAPPARTYDHSSSLTAVIERETKTVEQALEKIEHLVKTSNNPYFQHIRAVNEYYEVLANYKDAIRYLEQMESAQSENWDQIVTYINTFIMPYVNRLDELEKAIAQYLKTDSHPPAEYIEQITTYSQIIERNQRIDEFLNNPAVQIMALLPGAGVVTGALRLIQGNTFDGLLQIFGSVVTYGSFLRLSRVARAYRNGSANTVRMLYSCRYRNVVSKITTPDVMEALAKSSSRQSGAVLGNLFGTINSFKSIRSHVDSLAVLHRNRNYIREMTQRAIAGINGGMIGNTDQFILFLNQLGNTNATMEFFALLRILCAGVKGARDACSVTLDAMDDIRSLLQYKDDVPGVQEVDLVAINNVSTLFGIMRERVRYFNVDEIISKTTEKFNTDSSIITYFNEELKIYDRFGVRTDPDIPYQNSLTEMLCALEEIGSLWKEEKQRRDEWVRENRARYVQMSEEALYREWARNRGIPHISLNKQFDNLIEKLKGQIEYKEALTGKGKLFLLDRYPKYYNNTKIIYAFDFETFEEHASKLIHQYYY
ncbi:hypothetical protein QA601_08950 [Chitinispirillales bacterium ANBcel5]|uniref:hypothetical protein n=1 Tax=Cellulosispirillum alkaliphilum TaxID=3039283 RepID=UPI002A517A06|nr:hypothetical protein [Chitinispirillales bacterium ANBcel5]